MLLVLPHGPEHPWQSRQETPIDGRERRPRRLFGPRQVGPELGTEGGEHLVQQRRVEHRSRLAERAQRSPPYAQLGLHLGQGRRLLEAPQARHRGIEKVHEEQRRVLIIEQLPVASPIPRRPDQMEMVEQRPQQTKIL